MLTAENTLALVIDFQERIMPSIRHHEELARKAAIFIKGCRILGVPILATQQYTKGLGDTIQEIKDALGEFEPIEKISFSCFGNDEFRDKLRKTGKIKILVMGIETHICVQQTVLELLGSGYSVYVIADCTGTRFEPDYRYSEIRMENAGAVFTTAESALFEMMIRADHPKRKEISNLVK
jgi:nicotinamidase-related amidase